MDAQLFVSTVYFSCPGNTGRYFLLTFRKNVPAIRDVPLWLPLKTLTACHSFKYLWRVGQALCWGLWEIKEKGDRNPAHPLLCPQGFTAET